MIDHVEFAVGNLETSSQFFHRALAPLGYGLRVSGKSNGFGPHNGALDFWLTSGGPSTPRPHAAFNCSSRALVDSSYQAALAAGGVDNGAPKLLPHIHENYYAGFVRDPDGHNIEFVCHQDPEHA